MDEQSQYKKNEQSCKVYQLKLKLLEILPEVNSNFRLSWANLWMDNEHTGEF